MIAWITVMLFPEATFLLADFVWYGRGVSWSPGRLSLLGLFDGSKQNLDRALCELRVSSSVEIVQFVRKCSSAMFIRRCVIRLVRFTSCRVLVIFLHSTSVPRRIKWRARSGRGIDCAFFVHVGVRTIRLRRQLFMTYPTEWHYSATRLCGVHAVRFQMILPFDRLRLPRMFYRVAALSTPRRVSFRYVDAVRKVMLMSRSWKKSNLIESLDVKAIWSPRACASAQLWRKYTPLFIVAGGVHREMVTALRGAATRVRMFS